MFHSMAAALIGVVAFAGSTDTQKDADQAVYCRHRAFRIPVDLPATERANISAIRLFVSTDDGRNWAKHSDGPADCKTITFRSVRDGSYCFALALVNKDGTQTPADGKSIEPGLKVIIDTAQPSLMIKPVRSTAGKRGVRWEITDENAEPASIRLAYCTEGSQTWKAMPVRSADKLIQWFDDGVEVQKMQASVLDKAGNETVQEVEIAGDRFTKVPATTFALGRGPSLESPAKSTTVPVANWAPPPKSTAPAMPPASAMVKMSPPEESAPKPPALADKTWSPQVQTANHAQSNSHTSYSPIRQASSKPRDLMLCGAEPIVVNYEVERTPGMPAAKVELWGTRDKGATWTRLATDPDGVSPIEANLPQDGVWGLKIVTRAPGSPEGGPKPGTEPDTSVESDRLAPAVMVGLPEVQRSQVVVRWEASDKNLGATPVSIFYGRTPKGPWTEVAKNVENVGEYIWNFARAGVSGSVYFRVEVSDDAKNIGVSQSPIAVALEAAPAASGRVLQVQSRNSDRR